MPSSIAALTQRMGSSVIDLRELMGGMEVGAMGMACTFCAMCMVQRFLCSGHGLPLGSVWLGTGVWMARVRQGLGKCGRGKGLARVGEAKVRQG